MIASAEFSSGSAGVASAGSEDAQSSSIPSRDVRVMGGGDNSSPGALVRPLRGAVSSAARPEARAAPARSLHDATSGAEQPEASAANPMPNILGGLSSSSEDGAEVSLRHGAPAPAAALPPPAPEAVIGRPEALLAEQVLAARPSSILPPVMPRAVESRPSGPSPHDGAETSFQGARRAADPALFMSKFVWRTFFVYCLRSVYSFVYSIES